MTDKEEKFRKFVDQYDIAVPQDRVEQELYLIRQDIMHRMRYEAMAGGRNYPFPAMELEKQKNELLQAAVFEVKSELVLKDLIAKHGFTATREELEAEAAAMAERQNTTIEIIKQFFGEDLKMLESDVLKNKAREWIYAQMK